MKNRKILRILKKKIKLKEKQLKDRNKIIFKYNTRINNIRDKIVVSGLKLIRNESTQDLLSVVKFVIGYGVLGYLCYHSLIIRTHWYLMLPGFGALLYLLHDSFDFIWERIRIIWMRGSGK